MIRNPHRNKYVKIKNEYALQGKKKSNYKTTLEDPVMLRAQKLFLSCNTLRIDIVLHNTTCNPYHEHHLNILSMIRIGTE